MKKTIYCILIAVFVVGLVFSFLAGSDISGKEQLPLFDALRDFSAIVFGIVGVWMALVCPDAIGKIFSSGNGEIQKQVKRVKVLIWPLLLSAIAIFISMSVTFFSRAFVQVEFIRSHASLIKALSFSTIYLLYTLELACLVLALIPALFITDDISSAAKKKEASDCLAPKKLNRK